MPETEHSQRNLADLRTDVEQIRQLQKFAIASNPKSRDFIESHLADMKGAPQVYLALSEPKDLDALMKAVKKSKPQVSKICSHLYDQGLVRSVPNPSNPRSKLFAWTELETMLGVSRIAKRVARD